MAEIYLARHIGPHGFDKLVALKVLRQDVADDPEFQKMFFDEARVSALLSHPDIVQTFEAGEINDQIYMALEFVSGECLSRVLRRRTHRAMSRGLALDIVRRLALALHYAHTREDLQGNPLNLVHRDVTPSNVMLTFEGGVKLLDFGIAKASARSTQTQGGVIKGKLSYMSPEQIQSPGAIDRRSDVFSLGLVAWELLVGDKAIARDDVAKMLSRIVNEDVPPPSSVGADSDDELDAIVLRACARDPAQRYASGEDLAIDLQKYLAKSHPDLAAQRELRQLMAELIPGRAEQIKEIVAATADMASEVRRLREFEDARELQLAAQGSTAWSAGVHASGSGPVAVSHSRTVQFPEPSERSAAAPPPGRKRASWPVVLGVCAVVVLVAAALAMWMPEDRSMRVSSDPSGATVLVDGSPLGVTPLELSVSTARHQVALRLDGYEEQVEVVEPSGENIHVDARLRPEQQTWSVLVEADPAGAEVRLGDLPPQIAPAAFHDLPLGRSARLVVAAPGHRPEVRLVQPGAGEQRVQVALRPTQSAYVSAECDSCELYLDGALVGSTPVDQVEAAVGRELLLELRRGDEVLASERRTLTPGELATIEHHAPRPARAAARRPAPSGRDAVPAERSQSESVAAPAQAAVPTAIEPPTAPAAEPASPAPAPARAPPPAVAPPAAREPTAPPRSEPQLSVRIGSPSVIGAVDTGSMRAQVRRRAAAVETCYRRTYAGSAFSGTTQVRFRVGHSGHARDLAISGDGPAAFHSCLQDVFSGGGYPPSDVTGATVSLSVRTRAR